MIGPCLLVLLGGAAAAAGPPSVGVFVKSGPEVRELPEAERKAREKALSARYKEEYDAWVQLTKDLKKQFGKKVEKWPEEPRQKMLAAQRRVYSTEAERIFLKVDPKAADSVKDLRRHLEASKKLHLAASGEEAHLVVEILGRKGEIGIGSRNRLLYRVSPGGKAKARRPRPAWEGVEWPAFRYSINGSERYVLHSYTQKEPWWSVHDAQSAAWTGVAGMVYTGLDEFAQQNAESLTGVPAAGK